ncbi:PREDICTED: uncharacterized protein LOC108663627 [Theobroma cacao]|uniref:Uncharacterized protein LOC108663627 n=1 Tax=Theobroma cacao TaxID=3641 RepID=A0AB32WYK1_THECC|nr:PREDICTED: uncharacterized protein LOC108663627 [Theobroma cacao]
MIQTSIQFEGLPNDDLNAHISKFLEICDTFKHNGVIDDAIHLRLFPFSLRDKVEVWLNAIPTRSITTWDNLAQKFLAKFFPSAKAAKMRNDITSFMQLDFESLYETFYNILNGYVRTTTNATIGGALMVKSIDEAYDLLEEMASNNYQLPIERSMHRKVARVHDVDAFTTLSAQYRNSAIYGQQIVEQSSLQQLPPRVKEPSKLLLGSRTLLSDKEANPRREGKEHVNAIILRSGKEVESNPKQAEQKDKIVENGAQTTSSNEQCQKLETKSTLPPAPFPQRFKKQQENQFWKFMEMFKKLQINILFVKAFKKMPSYVKFLKDNLSKKRKLEDFQTVVFTKKCSVIFQNKLPLKLKEPGSFSIPYTIGSFKFSKALCDLGVSVSIMPMSIAKKLGLNEIQPITFSLQLVEQTIRYPIGIIKDVLLKVGHLFILVGFIVLEMEEEVETPLILEQPFLVTTGTIIDVKESNMTFKVGEEIVT